MYGAITPGPRHESLSHPPQPVRRPTVPIPGRESGAGQRLVRIGVPYLHYVRQDHAVEDAREIALTFALWAGPQLAELMRHDVVRINAYLDARIRTTS